jgi:hypothetical protein
MEELNIFNEAAPIIINFNPDDISRCPECNLICSLNLKIKNKKSIINYNCENNHKGNITLKDYLNQINKFALSKEKCCQCGKSQKEIKGNFFYCSKCSQFICNLCQIYHPNGNKHSIIDYQRYDSLCKKHSNLYDSYCENCKMNICVYCRGKHKNHTLINLFDFNNIEESKKNFENEINDLNLTISRLDQLLNDLSSILEKLKVINQIIKFYNIILSTYIYEENQNNLNYYVTQNLNNLKDIIKTNYINSLISPIYKEYNKCSLIFDSIMNVKQKNNNNLNYKILNNHTSSVNQIELLKDGRLISCSDDNTLKIYKKNTFELQLSIKEHTSYVNSFTQLYDERIITCSNDYTMKIIKLIGEEKYKVDQNLEGHLGSVYKIIAIRDNELISISLDKTMKIWIINNESKFNCINTITFQEENSWCNILKLNEKEFVISTSFDKCLKFWNSKDYSIISNINNVEIPENTLKNMCLFENDILCVGGENSKGFYLIKISIHQIIKNIIGPYTIFSINKCLDGGFLCIIEDEKEKYSIVKYKYENENLEKIEGKDSMYNGFINSCVELSQGVIATTGCDYSIKLLI